MPAVVVLVGEGAGDVLSGLAAVGGFGPFELWLDGSVAGIHVGVVVDICVPAHALAKLRWAEDGPIVLAGVLPAAVAVMDQTTSRLAIADCMGQGIEDEHVGHLLSEAPAHDAARTQVED